MATLAADVTATQTSWNVSAMPDADFLQADDEIVKVIDQRRTENRIRVQRGYAGTTAASHLSAAELTPIYVPSVAGEGGGGEESVLRQATVMLTDAQIKALPTTPVQVAPAAEAGTSYLLLWAYFRPTLTDPGTTFYENIAADGAIAIDSTTTTALASIANDNAEGLTQVTDLLQNNHPTRALGLFEMSEVWGPIVIWDREPVAEDALVVSADNGVSGNYTGGGVGNSLKVTVFYVIV